MHNKVSKYYLGRSNLLGSLLFIVIIPAILAYWTGSVVLGLLLCVLSLLHDFCSINELEFHDSHLTIRNRLKLTIAVSYTELCVFGKSLGTEDIQIIGLKMKCIPLLFFSFGESAEITTKIVDEYEQITGKAQGVFLRKKNE